MRKVRFRLAVAAVTAVLAGCLTRTDSPTAGVDDFPNSVYARVDGFLGQAQPTAALPTIPADAQGFLGAPAAAKLVAPTEIAAGKTALAKSAAASGSWRVAFDSTLVDPIVGDTLGVAHDTLYGLGTAPGQGVIYRAKSAIVYRSGAFDSVVTEDADGDSNIAAVPGRVCKNQVWVAAVDSGVEQEAYLLQGPGPDNDFNTQNDNIYYAARWWKMRGADTLATAVYASVDSDSVVIDNAGASLVVLDYRAWNPPGQPGVALSTIRLQCRVRYQTPAEVLGVSGENQLTTGGRQEFGLFNAQGGPDLDLNDTVLARFTQFGAPGDTLDSSAAQARMTLGGTWDRKTDDSTYALSITAAYRLGDVRNAVFSFTSSTPLPSGTAPRDGTVSLQLDYVDATALTLTGTLQAGALTADVTDRNGQHYHAVWDGDGRLLSVAVQ